jgi:hypothetical protein
MLKDTIQQHQGMLHMLKDLVHLPQETTAMLKVKKLKLLVIIHTLKEHYL